MLRLICYLAIAILNQLGITADQEVDSRAGADGVAELATATSGEAHMARPSGCILKENSDLNQEINTYVVF